MKHSLSVTVVLELLVWNEFENKVTALATCHSIVVEEVRGFTWLCLVHLFFTIEKPETIKLSLYKRQKQNFYNYPLFHSEILKSPLNYKGVVKGFFCTLWKAFFIHSWIVKWLICFFTLKRDFFSSWTFL